MSNGSNVTLIGNLTTDPTLRQTTGGASVTQFSIAVSRSWKNKADQWEEETSYFDVVAWSELANNTCESLKKGNRVIVNGRLEQQTWTKNDEKRSKVVLIADDLGPSLRKAVTLGIEKSGESKQAPAKSYKETSSFEDEEPF
jgi:single-strand DNA-binding protein